MAFASAEPIKEITLSLESLNALTESMDQIFHSLRRFGMNELAAVEFNKAIDCLGNIPSYKGFKRELEKWLRTPKNDSPLVRIYTGLLVVHLPVMDEEVKKGTPLKQITITLAQEDIAFLILFRHAMLKVTEKNHGLFPVFQNYDTLLMCILPLQELNKYRPNETPHPPL